MKREIKFNDVVYKVLREIVNEFQGKGYRFLHRNGNGALNDVTEMCYSGSLTAVLIWQMNRRLFYIREGREPQKFMDMFKHQLNVTLYLNPRYLSGAEVGFIDEHILSVSKHDFLFLLRDAIYSLYNECPKVSDAFPDHQSPTDKFITPAINTFISWKSIHQQIQSALLYDTSLIKKHDINEKVAIQLTAEVLEYLNNKQPNAYFPAEYISRPFEELMQEFLSKEKMEDQLINHQNQAKPELKAVN